MNDAQALELHRKYWEEDKTFEQLAMECDYSASNIYYHLVRKRNLPVRSRSSDKRALTPAEVRQARIMVKEGETIADVARYLGHPYSTVYGAVRGYFYEDIDAEDVAGGETPCSRCGMLIDNGDLCYYCERGL